MGTTYLGSVTVAGIIPPIAASLATLKMAVDAAFATIRSGLDLLIDAKASIRAAAVADLEVQLQASLAAQLSLKASIFDPVAYLNGLLAALIQVQKSLLALQPQLTLSAQLDASIAISAEIGAKIAALDLALSVILQIVASINAAITIPFPVLPTAPGVYMFEYDGALGGMGASLDASVSSSSELGSGTNVTAIVIVVDQGNAAALTGMRAVLKMA